MTRQWRDGLYSSVLVATTSDRQCLARRIARTAWSIYTYKTEFDPAHVHTMLAIPPKYAVSQFVGYMKGKSAIHLARVYGERKRNTNRGRVSDPGKPL
jgi:REP element-mobilizing transposase RayT